MRKQVTPLSPCRKLGQRALFFRQSSKKSDRILGKTGHRGAFGRQEDWPCAHSKPAIVEIPRIVAPDPGQFEQEYLHPGRPVVMTGLLEHWPSWGKWSLDWFEELYGNLVLSGNNALAGTRTVGVRDYVQAIRNGTSDGLYLDHLSVHSLPGMSEALRIPAYCPQDRECQILVWVGPSGTCLNFHKDNHVPLDGNQNLLAQLVGRKKVVLVSPADDEYMYPGPRTAGQPLFSQILLDQPNLEKFPLFARATLHQAVVGPGDVIFIPAHYWHYVRSLEVSMSVTFWWRASRLIELMTRFKEAARAGRLEEFLQQHAQSITLRDLEQLGGVENLRQLWQPLAPRVRELCERMLAPELKALVQA